MLGTAESSFGLVSSITADTRDAKDVVSELIEFALVNVVRTTAADRCTSSIETTFEKLTGTWSSLLLVELTSLRNRRVIGPERVKRDSS